MKTKILEKYKAIATEIYRSNPNVPDAGLSHYLLKDMQKAGFDPNQQRNPDGTWGDGGKMLAFEEKIRRNKKESATVYDKNGDEVFFQAGDEYEVPFTNEQMRMAISNGSILTHNHPESKSFSDNDMLLLVTMRLDEIRAVGEDYTYSMKYNKPTNMEFVEQWDKMNSALKESRKHAGKIVDDWFYKSPQSNADVDKANMMITWIAMEYLSEETTFGKKHLTYKVEDYD